MSKAASLVEFEHLPPGVWPIKDYPSLGATLVECSHEETKTVLLPHSFGGGSCRCFEPNAPYEPEPLIEHQLCVVCKSLDEDRPVKMLARLPKGGSLTLF